MSAFRTFTDLVGGQVRVSVLLSTDPGPARTFRPYLDVNLDEANALILWGELGLALQTLAARRPANDTGPRG